MQKRVHIILITSTAIFILLTVLFIFLFSVDIIEKQAQARGYSDIEQIWQDLSETAEKGIPVNFRNIIRKNAEIIPARIIIVDENSNLLADSSKHRTGINRQIYKCGYRRKPRKTVSQGVP